MRRRISFSYRNETDFVNDFSTPARFHHSLRNYHRQRKLTRVQPPREAFNITPPPKTVFDYNVSTLELAGLPLVVPYNTKYY